MCGSKGTQTTTSSFSPPPSVQANYDYLTGLAKGTAALPFQQYTGEMVAPLTPTQEAGIQNVNAATGLAQPYYQAGTNYLQAGATPFGQQALGQYMSPYLGNVVAQTMANLNETNAQQQQRLLGSAIQQGAFGGDRGKVAQAELARQQNLATGQTLANVLQGGYGQALGQFNADQARALQAGQTLGQFGTGAQTAALQGAQAQLSAGAQQQAIQQAQDVANQQQFQAAQAYPFQTTQYLANLLLGIGGQSGGTALTSQPQGNLGTSLLGGLLTAGQIFRPFKDGGGVEDESSMGGAVHEGLGRAAFAYDGGVDYIPYSEQPNPQKTMTLADVMRVPTKVIKPVGGKVNIPEAAALPKEGETLMDIAKQIANAGPEAKANLKGNIANIEKSLGLGTVASADVLQTSNYPNQVALSGMLGRLATGGVVGRHGYANDGAVKDDQEAKPQGRTLAEAVVGHPLSDEANTALLAAGLGMLSSKSPIFGIGVGEGATQGVATYYNALKNKRDYELELAKREIEAAKIPIEQQQAQAALLTAQSGSKDVALKTLQSIKQSYSLGTGDPNFPQGHVNGPFGKHISPEQYRQDMRSFLSGLGLFSPQLIDTLSDPAQLGSGAPVQRALGGPAEENKNTIEDKKPDASMNLALNEPANQPAQMAKRDQVSEEPIKVAQAQAAPQAAQPQAPNFDALYNDALHRLNIARQNPNFPNSKEIEEKALQDIEKFGPLAPSVQSQARDIEAQKKSLELGMTQMADIDKGLGTSSDTRPAARARINDASRLLSLWQSGKLSDIKAAAPTIAKALGMDVDKYKLDNAASYETFTKDATKAMFDAVKDLGGRILVTEIEGQKNANYNPDLQPKTNRNIIGAVKGLMDAEDKFFDDYNAWRAGDGKYATMAQYNAWKSAWRKNPENDIEKFIENGRANTPVRGDFSTKEKDLKAGYKYVIPPESLGEEQRAQYPNGMIARWTGKGWDASSLEAPQY